MLKDESVGGRFFIRENNNKYELIGSKIATVSLHAPLISTPLSQALLFDATKD